MVIDKLLGNQSIIVTLDVDTFLFERLKHIVEAGFSMVEINCTEETILKTIVSDFPKLRIGASNIISTEQLEACYRAGVHFASSPGFLPTIAQTAAVYSMNYLPGVATISEAMQAMALGYSQVRPYPANLTFCALLNKCLPSLNLFPAEIEWDEAEHYLSLPSVTSISILNPEKENLKRLSSLVLA